MRSSTESVYVVMWVDRHTDPDATVFGDQVEAIAWARSKARANGSEDDLDETLTRSMRDAGWLYYGCYSSEGDCLWVVERELCLDPSIQDVTS